MHLLPALIDLVKSQSDSAQEHTVGALCSLALNDDSKMTIGISGAICPLIHVLPGGSPGAQRDATTVLYHLSFLQQGRTY